MENDPLQKKKSSIKFEDLLSYSSFVRAWSRELGDLSQKKWQVLRVVFIAFLVIIAMGIIDNFILK